MATGSTTASMELDEANGGAGSAAAADPLLRPADLSGMRAAFRPAIPEEKFQEAASRLIDVKALSRPGVFLMVTTEGGWIGAFDLKVCAP